jgi:imidazolonepropionase-like amidohydrolase
MHTEHPRETDAPSAEPSKLFHNESPNTALSTAMNIQTLLPRLRTTLCLLAVGMITCEGVCRANPEIPGPPQQQPIALLGGTLHPISGPTIEDAIVLFDDGKIVAVGKDVALPAKVLKIDIAGKHVYPGLFDAYSNLGLVEINAVRATRDETETGTINPNVKAQVAVNPDSELIPVTRSNGVLLTLTAPTGGLISGTSAVLQLDGWTWEDLTLLPGAALHIDWPTMSPLSDWWVDKSPDQQLAGRDKALKALQDAFDEARAYEAARAAGTLAAKDARWEALLPVLRGHTPLMIAADDIQQIQAAVAFASQQDVRLILYGGYDAPRCAPLLKKHNIPVVVAGVYRLPLRRDDDYDDAYTLPGRLHAAGLKFCISGSGRFGASNVRNLPYHAATAVAYGLSDDEAIKAITLYPAQILGVDDRVGTLEAGKDATLIVTTGNPLETTSEVESAFIQGRRVDLSDRHKRLWRKYEQKYQRQR